MMDLEKVVNLKNSNSNHQVLTNKYISDATDSIRNTIHDLSTNAATCNITITDSSNVHLGNRINYDGSLYLNITNNKKDTGCPLIHNENNEVLIKTLSNMHISDLPIIQRSFWSARNPKEEYKKIDEPTKLVIISHTATTSSVNQAENIQLIRDIQAFHTDTHNWNDIGYNFLIGCDGVIYEGRGWSIEGAHTFGYNNRSIGISFIGCFINRMPTAEALGSCQKLIESGINQGHLAKNYKLLGHRQCCETESPGTKLYEEISKWDHFYNKSIDEDIISDDECEDT